MTSFLLAALLSVAPEAAQAPDTAKASPPAERQAAAQPAAAGAEAPLRLGMPSPLGEDQARKDAVAMSALLSEAMHRKVIAEVASPKELPGLLAKGGVDLGWLAAGEYVQAAALSKGGVVPVAKLVRGGMPFYRSAIFVNSKTGAKKLSELKGKRLAFVSEQSSAGFVLARQVLVSAGFKESDLKHETFLGDHNAVCKAVLDGTADAGATFANDGRGGSLAGCDETVGATKAKQLKVLATSDPIPNDVIAVRPDTSPATIELVRKALLGLGSTPEGRKRLEDLFHADAFVTADDTDFAPLRESRAGR